MAEIDYDKAIADAAREYVAALRKHDLMRTEQTQLAYELADEKLSWMVDAERYGWNPANYRSETEG